MAEGVDSNLRGNAPYGAKNNKTLNTKIDVFKSRLLGIVESCDSERAELQILYIWNPKEGEWSDLLPKPRTTWLNPPAGVTPGTLYSFSLHPEDPSKADAEDATTLSLYVQRGDKAEPTLVIEAIIERVVEKETPKLKRALHFASRSRSLQNAERVLEENFLNIEAIRRRYFEEGANLLFSPQPQTYLAVRERLAIGPVRLTDDGEGRWRVGETSIVPVLQSLSSGLYQGLDINGIKRFLLKPHSTTPQRIAVADFRSDQETIRDCLNNMAEDSSADGVALSLRCLIQDVEVTEEESMLRLHRLFRLEDAAEKLKERSFLTAALKEVVLALPEVKSLLDSEIQEARSSAIAHAQTELIKRRADADSEYADALTALKNACDSRDSAHKEATELRGELTSSAQKAEEIKSEISRLQSDLSAKTDERIVQVAASVTERILSGGVLGFRDEVAQSPHTVAFSQSSSRGTPHLPLEYPLKASTSMGLLEDGISALGKLRKVLNNHGVEDRAADAFLAALITRKMPVVIGPAASTFLKVAGDVLFGGKSLTRTVSPLLVEFAELFGKLGPVSAVFRPDPDRLADLLLTAGENDDYHLIVFDGFNRPDPEAVFMPLFDGSRTLSGKRLPILHPSNLPSDNPYSPLADISWPERFIAAFRYATGACRLPASILAGSAFILCEFGEKKQNLAGRRTAVPSQSWDLMRDALSARQDEAVSLLRSETKGAELRRAAASAGAEIGAEAAFCAALLACGVSAPEAVKTTWHCLFVAPLVMNGRDVPAMDDLEVNRYRVAFEGL